MSLVLAHPILEAGDGEKDDGIPSRVSATDMSADYLKSWPVPLSVPMRSLCPKGGRSHRFKYSYVKNWLIPVDGPMSIEHVHFLLDCFVVSAGPVPPQLGRYHPQSDPEAFVRPEDQPPGDRDQDPQLVAVFHKLQLGRYHPQSDPEAFARQEDPPQGDRDQERESDLDAKETPRSLADSDQEQESDLYAKMGPRSPVDRDQEQESALWARVSPRSLVNAGPSTMVAWPDEDDPLESYFQQDPPARIRRPEFTTQDDLIVRELSEMRLVLERLLDNHEGMVDWDQPHGLRDVLDLLPDGLAPLQQPQPHYPVGDWEFDECGVCLDSAWLYRRSCCRFPACSGCLQGYFSARVEVGQVKIECCNTACDAYVHRDEVSARLSPEDKERFHKLLVLANQDAHTKTCPRCSHVTKVLKKPKKDPSVTCPSCCLEWCFNCHAPWHGALSCKQFRKGDRLLKSWARGRNHGQLNAQKCPKCKIYIERTTGCDHMHCTRCKTDFCYKCGERFRYLKFFGDHYSKLSVFGCKYRFKADQPLQRKVIRGAVFGGRLIAAPVLGALALCAGALAVGISLFALPVYGGVRLYRHCEGRQTSKIIRRHPPTYHIPNISLHLSHSFP